MPPELYKNITERLNALQSGISMSVPDENIDVFNTAASKLRYALKAGARAPSPPDVLVVPGIGGASTSHG